MFSGNNAESGNQNIYKLSIFVDEKNALSFSNEVVETTLEAIFNTLKMPEDSEVQLYKDFFRANHHFTKKGKEYIKLDYDQEEQKKAETLQEKKDLIKKILGMNDAAIHKISGMGQGIANCAYLLLRWLRVVYKDAEIEVNSLYRPEAQDFTFIQEDDKKYVYQHSIECFILIGDENCLVLTSKGDIEEVSYDFARSATITLDKDKKLAVLTYKDKNIECKPFFQMISKSEVIFSHPINGNNSAENFNTKAGLSIELITSTNRLKYVGPAARPFINKTIPDSEHYYAALKSISFIHIPRLSFNTWQKEIAKIRISANCLDAKVRGKLTEVQVTEYIQYGEILLGELLSINKNALKEQLFVQPTWDTLPVWLSKFRGIFELTKIDQISSNPFKSNGALLNFSFGPFSESYEEKEYAKIENAYVRRDYLAAIVCMGWALYNRAALIGKEFERGSYTISEHCEDNRAKTDHRFYQCLLEYVKLVNQSENVHTENIIQHTTNLLIWQNKFAYSRNPQVGGSSHYKDSPLQFGIDIRFNENDYSLCALPYGYSHFIFGKLETGTFLKPEPVGIGSTAEMLLHTYHYLGGGHELKGGMAREKDIPKDLQDIYTNFCKAIARKPEKKIVCEMFELISDPVYRQGEHASYYVKFLNALRNNQIHFVNEQKGSETRLILADTAEIVENDKLTTKIEIKHVARAKEIGKASKEEEMTTSQPFLQENNVVLQKEIITLQQTLQLQQQKYNENLKKLENDLQEKQKTYTEQEAEWNRKVRQLQEEKLQLKKDVDQLKQNRDQFKTQAEQHQGALIQEEKDRAQEKAQLVNQLQKEQETNHKLQDQLRTVEDENQNLQTQLHQEQQNRIQERTRLENTLQQRMQFSEEQVKQIEDASKKEREALQIQLQKEQKETVSLRQRAEAAEAKLGAAQDALTQSQQVIVTEKAKLQQEQQKSHALQERLNKQQQENQNLQNQLQVAGQLNQALQVQLQQEQRTSQGLQVQLQQEQHTNQDLQAQLQQALQNLQTMHQQYQTLQQQYQAVVAPPAPVPLVPQYAQQASVTPDNVLKSALLKKKR